MRQIQREHMRVYHIPLAPVEREPRHCIRECTRGVRIPVKAVPALVRVPVVEEEVVQQSSPYERAAVGAYMQGIREREAHIRHLQRVLVHADAPMLDETAGHIHLV